MEYNELIQQIKKKHLEDVDLSLMDIDDLDFSDCTLKNVIFSKKKQSNRVLKNVNFSNAVLEDVQFCDAKMDQCSFEISIDKNKPAPKKTNLINVSFEKADMHNCRFRNAGFNECDFRYASISNSTFENSSIELCDFYRTNFIGQNIFYDCQLIDSSVPSYFEGSVIRQDNLANNRILQEDFVKYKKFLDEKRKKTKFDVDYSLKKRYKDAESMYRELSGLWNSKGYLSDANWAYIKARRMERKKLVQSWSLKNWEHSPKIFWNALCDTCFGYGENITRTILTYFGIVFLFAILLNFQLPNNSFAELIWYSIHNMIAQTPDEIKLVTTLADMLNLIQSSLGILITGILGFIIANKIRNQ